MMQSKSRKLLSILLALAMVFGLFAGMPLTANAAANHEFIIVDGTGISAGGTNGNEYSWDMIGRYFSPWENDTLNDVIRQLPSGETVEVAIAATTNLGGGQTLSFGNKVGTVIGDSTKEYNMGVEASANLTLIDFKTLATNGRALYLGGSTVKLTISGECVIKATTSQDAGEALYTSAVNLTIEDDGSTGPHSLLLEAGAYPVYFGNANNPRGTRTLTVNTNVKAVNSGTFRDQVFFMYCDALTIDGTGKLELVQTNPNGRGIYIQNVYQDATLNINGPLDLSINGGMYGIYFLNSTFNPTVNFNLDYDITISGGGAGHGIYSHGTGLLTVNNNGTGDVTLKGGPNGGSGIFANGNIVTGGSGSGAITNIEPAIVTIAQTDAVSDIASTIQSALAANDAVYVQGAKTGISATLTIDIPAGKKVVWGADYAADAGFTDDIISLSGAATGSFEVDQRGLANGIISAAGGYAINSAGPSVHIKRGLLFGYGAQATDVINVTPSTSAWGAVLAWNKASGKTQYYIGSDEDISIFPAEFNATWVISSSDYNIWYSGSGESGQYTVPGVTVVLYPAPVASIDFIAEKLINLNPGGYYGVGYSSSSSTFSPLGADGSIGIYDNWIGQTVLITKLSPDNQAIAISQTQSLPIPARPAAPTIGKADETVVGNEDGEITGVDATMEYQALGASSWASCLAGGTVEGLAPGIYYVRYKATSTAFYSEQATVTIAAGTGDVCQIGATSYTTLDAAIAAAGNTQTTIKLLANITVTDGLDLSGKKITFDLNGKNLIVTNPGGYALELNDSTVNYTGVGAFRLLSAGSIANSMGLYAGGGVNTLKVTALEVSGLWNNGGIVCEDATLTFTGNIVAVGSVDDSLLRANASVVTINGSINNTVGGESGGIFADYGSAVTINGNISTAWSPVWAQRAGTVVRVNGNITCTGTYEYSSCIYSQEGAKVFVNGNVTTSTGYFVETNGYPKAKSEKDAKSLEAGYDQYSAGIPTAYVYVKALSPPRPSGGGGGVTTYTVTFNSNGGGAVSSQSVRSGDQVTKPADPDKTGFDFAGWYTDAALTDTYDFSATVTSSFALYAKWTEKDKNPFKDVKESDWFYSAVMTVYDEGLFSGTSANLFSPGAPMTRAMFATVLARLDGADLSGYKSSPFSDVAINTWYGPSVAWAAEKGIVLGVGEGCFAPDVSVTREQMAAILYRYIQHKGYTLPSAPTTAFADEAKISDWAKDAVQAIQSAGIINGKPGNLFDPQGTATRAEVATIFERFINLSL